MLREGGSVIRQIAFVRETMRMYLARHPYAAKIVTVINILNRA